jgi:hypothetical protein
MVLAFVKANLEKGNVKCKLNFGRFIGGFKLNPSIILSASLSYVPS